MERQLVSVRFLWGISWLKGDPTMDQHDWELLEKQLSGVTHKPPRDSAIFGFMAVAVFLAGMAIGGILVANESKQTKMLSDDAMAAIALQNGVSLIMR
jgi:hypothetical protein